MDDATGATGASTPGRQGPDAPSDQPGPEHPRRPDGEGRRFELHAFVCVSDSACGKDGPAMAIRDALKKRLKAAGLKEEVRINKSGCLGQCGHGPMMVVYPEGVWYSHLGLEDVDRIWTQHIIGGEPVEALQYRTSLRGTNVLPMKDAEARIVNTQHPLFSPCSRCRQRR